MTVLESLSVDIFGIAIVFSVLIALSLMIKLISKILGGLHKKESKTDEKADNVMPVSLPDEKEAQYGEGELKLVGADEKTAALVMAIVSHKTSIPLSRLNFKAIRLIEQEVNK